jgi:hypothetical protein
MKWFILIERERFRQCILPIGVFIAARLHNQSQSTRFANLHSRALFDRRATVHEFSLPKLAANLNVATGRQTILDNTLHADHGVFALSFSRVIGTPYERKQDHVFGYP